MKRFVSILLFTLIIVGIVGCGKKEQTVPVTPNAMVPSIIYEGIRYRTTGKEIPAEVDESAIVGRISSVVPLSQLPTKEGEANFGEIGDPYALTSDGLLVLMNNDWVLFDLFDDTDKEMIEGNTIIRPIIESEETIRIPESSPSPAWNGEFTIELPEGYTITTDENGNQIYSDGTQAVGGMTIRTVPEGFKITEYFKKDFLIALGIEEAANESLGYYGEGSTGGMGPWGWSEEYFSDVPDSKDRTIHTSHQFFIMSDEKTVLDFWIDLMIVDNAVKDQILMSIEIPEIERYRQEPAPEPTISQDAPYELLDLPEGYTVYILDERCIQFFNDKYPVGGLDVIKIPDGAYDPDDAHWIWLEKAGISDFNSANRKVVQYLGGMTGSDNTWIAEFAGEDPEIHRQHIYRVIGNDLYDLWFELHLITREEAEELAKEIQCSKE